MTRLLNREEIEELGEYLLPGNFLRVNHKSQGCTGDSDSLRIARGTQGELTAKCFRCGRWYAGRTVNSFLSGSQVDSKARPKDKAVISPKELYDDLGVIEEDPDLWPPQAKLAVVGKLERSDIMRAGICWSANHRRLVFPTFGDKGLHWYSLKKVNESDPRPKYYTRFIDEKRPTSWVYSTPKSNPNYLVIVEDLMSAVKVSNICPAIPLHTTFLNPYTRELIRDQVSQGHQHKVFIWLDDDNAEVRRHAMQLREAVRLMVPPMADTKVFVLHTGGKDPKEHSLEEIIDLILPYSHLNKPILKKKYI